MRNTKITTDPDTGTRTISFEVPADAVGWLEIVAPTPDATSSLFEAGVRALHDATDLREVIASLQIVAPFIHFSLEKMCGGGRGGTVKAECLARALLSGFAFGNDLETPAADRAELAKMRELLDQVYADATRKATAQVAAEETRVSLTGTKGGDA